MPHRGDRVVVPLAITALLMAAGVQGVCPTCRGPQWSWDTVPAFVHGSEDAGTLQGGFSATALAIIAKFPMVTIEKVGSYALHSSVTPIILI